MGFLNHRKKNKEPKRVEKYGLLFCLEGNYTKIIDRIEALFQDKPDQEINTNKANYYTLRNNDMEIVFVASGLTKEKEGQQENDIKDQLKGVQGFVYSIQTEHVDIKRNLLYHLRQCKGFVQIVFRFDSASAQETAEKMQNMVSPVLMVAEKLQGVLTFGDGTAFINSKGQLILGQKGNTKLEYYMPAEIQPDEDWGKGMPQETLDRKERSMAWLKEKRIYVSPWLPFLCEIEANGPARTTREICGRAAALLAVSLYSECRLGEGMDYEQAKEFITPVMERFLVEEFLSPKEKNYLENPESAREEQVQYSWQYENLLVMEWALGLVDELPYPDNICDVGRTVRVLHPFDSLEEFEQGVCVRSYKELLDAADLIYRLDWACVDARVMGMKAPAGLDAGVVMERHHSLFWLAGVDACCAWDEVDLST